MRDATAELDEPFSGSVFSPPLDGALGHVRASAAACSGVSTSAALLSDMVSSLRPNADRTRCQCACPCIHRAKYQEAGQPLHDQPRTHVNHGAKSMRSASARQASWTVCTSPTATADVFRISANRFFQHALVPAPARRNRARLLVRALAGPIAGGASETSRIRPCPTLAIHQSPRLAFGCSSRSFQVARA